MTGIPAPHGFSGDFSGQGSTRRYRMSAVIRLMVNKGSHSGISHAAEPLTKGMATIAAVRGGGRAPADKSRCIATDRASINRH